jgi:hypothetical protein
VSARTRRLACALALAAAVAVPARAAPAAEATAPAAIGLEAYRAELAELLRRVEAGDAAAAREQAGRLASARVDAGEGGVIVADRSVLGPLAAVEDGTRLQRHARRLRVLLASLSADPAGRAALDRALLADLQRQQAVADLERGGSLLEVGLKEPPALQRARAWAARQLRRVGDALRAIWRFLRRLLPTEERPMDPAHLRLVIGALVGLVVALLAFVAWRATRRRPPAAEGPSVERGRRRDPDEDPLTRSAQEWERHAVALASAGRSREALRAWFHAVLVTLYAAGALHHRKGRTNWEHLATLQPGVPFRADLRELVRGFDRAWYGMDTPAPEDLDAFAATARDVMAAARAQRGAA